jgi:hypothetical protein
MRNTGGTSHEAVRCCFGGADRVYSCHRILLGRRLGEPSSRFWRSRLSTILRRLPRHPGPRIPSRSALQKLSVARILHTLDFGVMMGIAYPLQRSQREIYGELLFRQAAWHATLLHPFLYVVDLKRVINFGEAQVYFVHYNRSQSASAALMPKFLRESRN